MSDSHAGISERAKAPSSKQKGPDSPGTKKNIRLIAWFNSWRKPLRRWIARNPSVPAAEVDDLTQEVFLRLLRYGDDVLVENPQGYLFRVAIHVVHGWRERCSVRMAHDDSWLAKLQIDPSDEPGNELEQASASRHLWAAVDRLPPRQRELLLLHLIEGMTYKQIAQARGLTYRMVARDLARAYETLRNKLLLDEL